VLEIFTTYSFQSLSQVESDATLGLGLCCECAGNIQGEAWERTGGFKHVKLSAVWI